MWQFSRRPEVRITQRQSKLRDATGETICSPCPPHVYMIDSMSVAQRIGKLRSQVYQEENIEWRVLLQDLSPFSLAGLALTVVSFLGAGVRPRSSPDQPCRTWGKSSVWRLRWLQLTPGSLAGQEGHKGLHREHQTRDARRPDGDRTSFQDRALKDEGHCFRKKSTSLRRQGLRWNEQGP